MALVAGARLGPYEVVDLLGVGGMGEVYRARDPRLGREVAVKILPAEVARSAQRLARFEHEARAVAALNHPNILTIYDVGTFDAGSDGAAAASDTARAPFVVTELLEGETLRALLGCRVATQRQVLAYAVQIARGLSAAHAKGIVHRDVKPANVFVTTDGRVKILDFGLAKVAERRSDAAEETESSPTETGQVVGTVRYMSPEQVRGLAIDHRSDIFSFGVVLYELLSGRHPFSRETTVATLTAILDETPPELKSLSRAVPPALSGIVRRCLEKSREDRFHSAHDLALSLDAVLNAAPGAASLQAAEERSPYPGLSSFTEKDAGVFFGREQEVEALWRRLQSRKLLAVIGPSGAGKTSFLRAGLLAGRPSGWAAVYATPGASPVLSLAQAFTAELAGDAEAMGELLSGVTEMNERGTGAGMVAVVRRWRSRHGEALLVVDQFEELFTLSGSETQERYARLVSRLASEADVHVVLSLRDDFLMRSQEHAPLRPILSELTALLPLSEPALRAAILEPARKRGYGFEDDALVAEMTDSVEGARAALPLLAFAMARLWEKRDRERRLLTRAAYEEIGGVAGALAQHADAMMDRIGGERHDTVREIFRNLVTAQGTRAVVDRHELLSAFKVPQAASDVLATLVDARLLTTYEVQADAEQPRHRVEVVHESLLKAWPRLVRWQAQDEDGAVLRDQLKQAAHLWDDKGRTNDLLWTGTAFQEFALWRARYEGALTALEEEFARAMAAKARRRRRLVSAAVASVIVSLAAVAIVVSVSRHKAIDAADRAEASRALALAQARLADDPTEALALATASLQIADTAEARVFALRALWEAPPALELKAEGSLRVAHFSPNGRWMAVTGHSTEVRVWSADGRGPLVLTGNDASPRGANAAGWATNDLLVTGHPTAQRAHLWTLPEGKRIRTFEFGEAGCDWHATSSRLLCETWTGPGVLTLQSLPLSGGPPERLGVVDWKKLGAQGSHFTSDGKYWVYRTAGDVIGRPMPVGSAPDQRLAHLDGETTASLRFDRQPYVQKLRRPDTAPADAWIDESGRWVANGNASNEQQVRLWDVRAWSSAAARSLRRSGSWYASVRSFHPTGDWVVASGGDLSRLTFWPLHDAYPLIVDGYAFLKRPVAFSPDGKTLLTSWNDLRLRLWSLPGSGSARVQILPDAPPEVWWSSAFDRGGGHFVACGGADRAFWVALDGSRVQPLPTFDPDTLLYACAVSPSGGHVATAFGFGKGKTTLRVWDVETGQLRALDLPDAPRPPTAKQQPVSGYERGIFSLAFADESTVYSAGDGGLRRWNLDAGSQQLIAPTKRGTHMAAVFDRSAGVAVTTERSRNSGFVCSSVVFRDLARGTSRELAEFGDCVSGMHLDPSGAVLVTSDKEGTIRVGRLSGGQPHLLLGHKGAVNDVAISPDLRWVASAGEDNTLRLWPMPNLDQLPFHTLPPDALIAKLHSLTNLRAVRDDKAPNGWRIDTAPFPGWKDVPTWNP